MPEKFRLLIENDLIEERDDGGNRLFLTPKGSVIAEHFSRRGRDTRRGKGT